MSGGVRISIASGDGSEEVRSRQERHSAICDFLHTSRRPDFISDYSFSTPPQRACFTLCQSTNSAMHDYPLPPRPTRRSCLFPSMVPQTVVTQGMVVMEPTVNVCQCQHAVYDVAYCLSTPFSPPLKPLRVPYAKTGAFSLFNADKLHAYLLPCH